MNKNETKDKNVIDTKNQPQNNKIRQQNIIMRILNKYFIDKIPILLIIMITLKITCSLILSELYLSYTLLNPEDIAHNQRTYFMFYIAILYPFYLSIFTSPQQENIDCYFYQKSKQILDINNYSYTDCEFCKQKKYKRTSHCRQCKKCILYRDHHCPYVSNCIGLKNIQYFINFLIIGIYSMVVENLTYLRYYFDKKNTNMNFPLRVKIYFALDFSFNVGFFNGVFILLIQTLLVVYSNSTTLENIRYSNVTSNSFCCNILTKNNKTKKYNEWNIGFLSHFYHVIGITPLQFLFPLNKFSNNTVEENLPPLLGCKNPDNLQIYTFLIKNNFAQKENLLNGGESDPDNFIKLCHEAYDGKIIN